MSTSALVEMATAIREVVQRYGARLNEVPTGDLHDFALILSAFAEDCRREEERRERESIPF